MLILKDQHYYPTKTVSAMTLPESLSSYEGEVDLILLSAGFDKAGSKHWSRGDHTSSLLGKKEQDDIFKLCAGPLNRFVVISKLW